MILNRHFRFFLLGAIALLGVVTALGSQKDTGSHKRAKARYFFIKGAELEALDRQAEALELYRKAYVSDPTFADAAYAYGANRIMLAEDTFSSPLEMKRSLGLMKSLVEEYPQDLESAERYAYMAALTDTFPEALRVYRRLVAQNPDLSRLYVPLSIYHINEGHADSAVYAIREYERLEGGSTETLLRKIRLWISKEDTVAALREARLHAEANPGEPEPAIDRAMIYGVLGQPDSAILILEDVIAKFPEKSTVKFNIALMYAEKGDSARFHQLTDEAFRGSDLEYEDRMAILATYTKNLPFGAADYPESDRLYEYAATLYPEDADFFDQYADYELLKKDYPAVFEKAKKALELNPSDPFFLGRAMTFSILADRPEEGMKIYENFSDSEVKKAYNLMLTYVSAAQNAGEYDKALHMADSIVANALPGFSLSSEITPETADSLTGKTNPSLLFQAYAAYETAGDIYALLKQNGEAARSYENSINLQPGNNANALNNYAYFIVETLKAAPGTPLFEKAKDMSRKSLEQTGDNPQGNYYDTYAWILFKEQNYKDALTYQEMAIETEGEGAAAEFFDHYGDILFMSGRPDDALLQWQKALELDSDNALLQKKVAHKTFFYE